MSRYMGLLAQFGHRHILRSALLLFTVTALLLSIIAPTAMAVVTISQSYTVKGDIAVGSLVSLKTNTIDEISLANIQNAGNIFGVVISAENSLLTISGKQGTQVQVATGGTVDMLVSDQNGDIKQGDPITGSPINGVGMKASENVRIVGLAQADAKKGKAQKYKPKGGEEETVHITTIPVLVNVAYFFKEPEKTLIPTAIQNIANGIAGKKVDSLPILISAGIFLVMLIVVASLVYSMIRASIISIGRNPLSQSSVYRNLIQLSALVLVIASVGFVLIYMVLTRL